MEEEGRRGNDADTDKEFEGGFKGCLIKDAEEGRITGITEGEVNTGISSLYPFPFEENNCEVGIFVWLRFEYA